MYHINKKGDPGVCSATQGKCPFGGPENHFDSAVEARTAFETAMESEAPLGTLSSESLPAMEIVAMDDEVFNREDHSVAHTPESVSEKFEKEIAGNSYPLKRRDNPGEPGHILESLFGKSPDSDPTADLGAVELKTLKRSSASRSISLGAIAIGGDKRLLKTSYLPPNFLHSLKAGEWTQNGNRLYSLKVDREKRRVNLVIADKRKRRISKEDFGWDFSVLEKKVDGKLAHIAVGIYDTNDEEDGTKSVTFEKMVMGGFTRESMIDKIESGEVHIDFRFSGRHSSTTLTAPLRNFSDFRAGER